ncbi:MAG: ROK family protein [Flavobacteriales bacterium]|nr:MAG: ROK family protein [Flavobacteriales bacterium]
MEKHYLGIDIGGTKIKTVVLDEEGTVLERNQISTEDTAAKSQLWKSKILSLIAEKTKVLAYGNTNLLKCGISAPGLVDSENRKIINMPERLSGIENFDWSDELQREIVVVNDGHSACLAEYDSYYRAKGIKNMLMLTLGTGVGGGIVIDGKLYQGHLQRAGHVGHMTVDHTGAPSMTNMPGSLEQAFGNFSVFERTHGQHDSINSLVAAYRNGNPLATYWWLSSVQKLATALTSMNNILAPEVIVLGGGITAGARDALMRPLADFMGLYEWRPGGNQVVVSEAKHGNYAGAIGAAFFARSIQNQQGK